jgi:hypothetical protein
MVREFTMFVLDQQLLIKEWRPQLWDRGKVYIAEDVRGVYQLFSHTMKGLQAGIHDMTCQQVSSSSLFEASNGQLKGGTTAGTFTVRSFTSREEAIQYLNQSRGRFEKRVGSFIDTTSMRFVNQS